MFPVSDLIAPLSESAPCGENLEYDSEFLALGDAAAGKPEQQYGDTLIPAVPPDWSDVYRRSLALLERSRDLRLVMLLLRGAAGHGGMPGAAAALELLAGMLESQWDAVHPQLDVADGNDPTMRVSALLPLADPLDALGALRAASVSGDRGLTLRALELASGKTEPFPGESVPAQAEVAALLAGADAAGKSVLPTLRSARDAMQRIDRVLQARLDSAAPDLHAPLRLLERATDVAERALGAQSGADTGAAAAAPAASGQARAASAGGGAPSSRADVIRLLDQAVEWIERHEPTNPAPLLIRRAQRLMGMSFLEIVQELAPDGVAQVENVAGTRRS